mmetsp:Transcript_5939/g.8944  ORF Transcript_5939/g.8944 Transcript_5939/m.8944 type:complete len:86 (+) Transcript_5939:86-343(+)
MESLQWAGRGRREQLRQCERSNCRRVVAFVSAVAKVCKFSSSKSFPQRLTSFRYSAEDLKIAPSDSHSSLPLKKFSETLNDSKYG